MIHYLQTCHNTYLAFNEAGCIVHREGGARAGLFVVDESRAIICWNDIFIPVSRSIFEHNLIGITHPLSHRYYCAIPSGEMETRQAIGGDWELFKEEQCDDLSLFRDALSAIGQLAPLNPTQLLAEISKTTLRYSESILCAFLSFYVDDVANLPAPNDICLRRLASQSRPWIQEAADTFIEWKNTGRTVRRVQTADRHLDDVARVFPSPKLVDNTSKWRASESEFYECIGEAFLALARSLIKPRLKTCIVATARNEGMYLTEWISYHKSLGFSEIIIYTNNNSDGSDELLRALADRDEIVWIRNSCGPSIPPQLKAYAHGLSILPEILDFEWALFIDIDEFFVVNSALYSGVDGYISSMSPETTDVICLNWLMFGTFGLNKCDADVFLTERCNIRYASIDPHIKSLFRPQKFRGSHPHYPNIKPLLNATFKDSKGNLYDPLQEFALAKYPIAINAWINHYWSKSLEELFVKFSRNSGDKALSDQIPVREIVEAIVTRVISVEKAKPVLRDDRIQCAIDDARTFFRSMHQDKSIQQGHDRAIDGFFQALKTIKHSLIYLDTANLSEDERALVFLFTNEL